MGRKGLSEEMTFKLRPDRQERASQVSLRGQSVVGRGYSKCKGPEAETNVVVRVKECKVANGTNAEAEESAKR